MPSPTRSGRIPSAEWPKILARRENGESFAAIGRDYGVTGPAIRYIVDKAQAAKATTSDTADPALPPMDSPSGSSTETEVSTEKEKKESEREPVEATGQKPRTELSQRLLGTAEECAILVDRAMEGSDQEETDDRIKAVLHELRRAAAAIEIALSRRSAGSSVPPPRSSGPGIAELRRMPATRAAEGQLPGDGPSFADSVEGTVKFFQPDKGFGFVVPDHGGGDIYVPLKALQRSGIKSLRSAQRVRVSVTAGTKGPEATEIALLPG